MDLPGQKHEMHAADDGPPPDDGPEQQSQPQVPFTFFDPASMQELHRTMTARSTRSHRPQDRPPPPAPLPKPKKADKRKSAISVAMESGSGGDDDFNFEQTLKDLVRRYLIWSYSTSNSDFSQTGRRVHKGPRIGRNV